MSEVLRFQQRVEKITAEKNGNGDEKNASDHVRNPLLEPLAALEVENPEGKNGDGGEYENYVRHTGLRVC